MSEEEVEIEIAPDGKVTVTTKGMKGPACIDVADLFVQMIGREESREKTPEYYEASEQIARRVDVKQRR